MNFFLCYIIKAIFKWLTSSLMTPKNKSKRCPRYIKVIEAFFDEVNKHRLKRRKTSFSDLKGNPFIPKPFFFVLWAALGFISEYYAEQQKKSEKFCNLSAMRNHSALRLFCHRKDPSECKILKRQITIDQ